MGGKVGESCHEERMRGPSTENIAHGCTHNAVSICILKIIRIYLAFPAAKK